HGYRDVLFCFKLKTPVRFSRHHFLPLILPRFIINNMHRLCIVYASSWYLACFRRLDQKEGGLQSHCDELVWKVE
ncbi:MAG: hypothetical protein ACJA1Q_001060, partial [Pseudohongiellaceae bacterium]